MTDKQKALRDLRRLQKNFPQIRALANEVASSIREERQANVTPFSKFVRRMVAEMLTNGLDVGQASIEAHLRSLESPSGVGEASVRLPDGTDMPIQVTDKGRR